MDEAPRTRDDQGRTKDKEPGTKDDTFEITTDYRDGTGGSFSSPGLLWTPRIFSASETIR